MISIQTYTHTYTHTRIDVIGNHFKMFLACSGMDKTDVKKLLEAVRNRQIEAVGIYIEDRNRRIYEVSFETDWELHRQMVSIHGEKFDTDRPGWSDDGLAPEAYIAAQDLVDVAKEMRKPVCSWIRVTPEIRSNKSLHRKVCEDLGYNYGSSPPPWESETTEKTRKVHYLEESSVITRVANSRL